MPGVKVGSCEHLGDVVIYLTWCALHQCRVNSTVWWEHQHMGAQFLMPRCIGVWYPYFLCIIHIGIESCHHYGIHTKILILQTPYCSATQLNHLGGSILCPVSQESYSFSLPLGIGPWDFGISSDRMDKMNKREFFCIIMNTNSSGYCWASSQNFFCSSASDH